MKMETVSPMILLAVVIKIANCCFTCPPAVICVQGSIDPCADEANNCCTPAPAAPAELPPTVKACINGADTALTPTGTKRIDQLIPGDQVAVALEAGNESGFIFEKIQVFLHRDADDRTFGIRLSLASGKHVTLSPYHLVLLAPDGRSIFAKTVKIGQKMHAVSIDPEAAAYQEEEIVGIEPVAMEGKFSPLTKSGKIIVNDILISCYSHQEDHHLMHFAVQWLMTFFGSDNVFASNGLFQRADGLHVIASSLSEFFQRYFVFM